MAAGATVPVPRHWHPPGAQEENGLSFVLPAETLAWAPVCRLQQPQQVPRCHGSTERQILAIGDRVHPGACWGDVCGGCPGECGSQLGVHWGPPHLFAAARPGLLFAKPTVILLFFCTRVLVSLGMADLEANFLTLASSLALGHFFCSQQTSVLTHCKSIIAGLTGLLSGPAVQITRAAEEAALCCRSLLGAVAVWVLHAPARRLPKFAVAGAARRAGECYPTCTGHPKWLRILFYRRRMYVMLCNVHV